MIDLKKIERPLVMGILNVTPDSFYSKSRSVTVEEIAQKINKLIEEGADIIDIGAYSSRPGADDVSESEEIKRLSTGVGLLKDIAAEIPFSVDTFRANVVKKIYNCFGKFIVNDISAGELDNQMFETVAKLQLPYIAMHMKGNPQNMQNSPHYNDLMKEIAEYFAEKIEKLNNLGVKNIVLDPGFGFAKSLEHNYKLLANLSQLNIFGLPLLVGFSRKSMLYKLLQTTPENALNATTTVNAIALTKGAKILRVHDVKEAVECVCIFEKMKMCC